MADFTPGPWMARQKYTGISIYTRDTDGYNGDDGAIANMIMSRDKTPCKVWADARLIAAAPEMKNLLWDAWQDLNALSNGDQSCDARYEATETMEKIMSLLRRIEGEEGNE